MLDILFVHPNSLKKIYQELANKHAAIEYPIWAWMLRNTCVNKGHKAEILDCEVLNYNYKDTIDTIKYLKPKLLCFVIYGQQPSASTQNMEGAISLAEKVKQELNIPIIFVGGHVAAVHDEVLRKHQCIDYICQNEGVYTILDLIKCYKNGTRLDYTLPSKNDLIKIPGLGWRSHFDSLKIIMNIPSNIVPQNRLADDLPPTFFINPKALNQYRTAGWHAFTNDGKKSPFAALYTSLGCPFKCHFCCINTINRTTHGKYSTQDSAKFRYWNPEFIIKNFDFLARNNIRNIKIADELFVLKPTHFLKICDLIIERKYDFNIWCYGRIDITKQKYLEKLKRAGVNFIGLGIESINKKVRRNVTKGKFENVEIGKVISDIENAGIEVGANYIFGLPEDTHQSMQETLDFAIDKCTAMANMYSNMPYPGSKLYLDTKMNNPSALPDSYTGYAQHSYECKPLASRYLNAKEILQFRDNAWMKYHTNPNYLKIIKEKFGEKPCNSIKEVTKVKLKRKIVDNNIENEYV